MMIIIIVIKWDKIQEGIKFPKKVVYVSPGHINYLQVTTISNTYKCHLIDYKFKLKIKSMFSIPLFILLSVLPFI